MTDSIIFHDAFSQLPEIVKGERTEDLLNRLAQPDSDEKETLLLEAKSILAHCTRSISQNNNVTGLALGFVQSGKTMSFTLLTALAIDNNFRIVIYFAGIKNNLLDQTTKRLKEDLLIDSDNTEYFKIYQNPQEKNRYLQKIKRVIDLKRKPAILITVLKKSYHINNLSGIFSDPEMKDFLSDINVLIIDDEADQASLNTYAYKNSRSSDWEGKELSATYASILKLRSKIPRHAYIQYTATPQANLLINLMDLLSPQFHVVLTPGKAYTGGQTFFVDKPELIISIPDEEKYHYKRNRLSECPQSLTEAIQQFLIGVAIIVKIWKKEKYLSMMIHPASEKEANRQFHEWVDKIIEGWRKGLKLNINDICRDEIISSFEESYSQVISRITNPPSFADVMQEIEEIIPDTNIELVIAGAKSVEWNSAPAHILVGADMLNRGYTIKNLSVSYMPRYSVSITNADTIQQRCRFFGYKKKYIEICRVFLPNESILEYCEYVKHEELLRQQLKTKTLDEFEQYLILNGEMNPTRNNILSNNLVKHKLNGWRQINALDNIQENTELVKDFIASHTFTNYTNFKTPDRNHRYTQIDIPETIEFLRKFRISNVQDTLRKSSTIQYLRYLFDKKIITHAFAFEMAYGVKTGRERSLVTDEGVTKINNIFSGRSTSGSNVYPGDKAILREDYFCIQIHKVKIKANSRAYNGKVIYTLGLYYPNNLSHSFFGLQN